MDKPVNYKAIEAKLKRKLLDANPRCFFCGKTGVLSLTHLIRKSYSKSLSIHPGNVVLSHVFPCHDIFDNRLSEWNNLDQKKLNIVLGRIKKLDELYYNRLIDRAKEAGWVEQKS